jgi:outer membrane protein
MRTTRIFVTGFFVLVLLALPYRAFAFLGLEAGVGYWNQTPSGTFGYQPVTGTIGDIDLKDDLNFKSKSNAFVRVKAELPLILPNIYLMATPMSFDGSGLLTRSISFGNQTFTASTNVQSKVKLDHYDAALYYPIPLLKTASVGVLNVDLGLNARKIDFQGTITSAATSASKSLSLSAHGLRRRAGETYFAFRYRG